MKQSKYTVGFLLLAVVLSLSFSWMQPAGAQTPQGYTWVRIASQPRPNGEAQSVVLNGKLYSFSGFAPCCTPMRRAYSYDPKEDVWVQLADMPKGITHAGIATDGVRYIYIGAGYPEKAGGGSIFGTNEVWRYDSVTNTYQTMPPMPARNGTGQMVYLNNKLHYIGGQTPDTRIEDLDTHWVLNLGNLAAGWTNAAPLPVPRQHAAAVVLNGQIYYIGGQKNHDANLVPQNALHRYNPATNTWTTLAPMPGVGRNHNSATSLVINGKIVVFGGQTYNYQLTDDVTEYDPATNTWREVGKLFAPRGSGIAGYIDGVVYYATGSSAASYKAYVGPMSPIKIENFNLVDAAEDYPVAVLRDGSTIDISALPPSLSIGVVFSGWPVGSVVMGWNGNPRFRVENGAPFAFFDNSGTDYSPGSIPLGENVITATPYSGANGSGTAGIPLTIRFNVVRSSFANRAPLVTNPGNITNTANTSVSRQIVASDPDGNAITYSASGLPPGLSINAGTGLITGTPNTQGIYNVTLTVTDNASPPLSTSTTFKWTIAASVFAVHEITFIDPVTDQKVMNIVNGRTYNVNALPKNFNIGIEYEGYPIGSMLFGLNGNPRYKSENLPVYSLFENSGNNYGPGNLPLGTHTLTVTPYRLNDGTGDAGVSKTVTFTLVSGRTTNVAPNVTVPPAQTSQVNQPITPLQIVASDPDGDAVTFTDSLLPAGLTLNPTTGVISGTPTSVGAMRAYVTVTDDFYPPYSTSVSFNWSVVDSLAVTQIVLINAQTDQPILNITDGMTINLADQPPQLNVGVVTTNVPIGSIVFGFNANTRFRVENLPVYGLFDNSGSNYLPGNLPVGEHTLTATPYTGSNGGGRAGTSRTVTFSVINQAATLQMQSRMAVNQPPTLTAPTDQTSAAGTAIPPLQIAAADPENGALRYGAEGLPSGLTLDAATGVISGTPTLAGAFTVTLTVLDSEALTSTAPFLWTVTAPPAPPVVNQAPSFTPLTDQSGAVGTPLTLNIVASDPDGQPLTYSAAGLPAGLTLDSATGLISGTPTTAGASAVTITVTDSGTPPLSATLAFTWTVAEAAAPVIPTNEAPTLTPLTDQSSMEGDVIALQVVAADIEGAVSYAAVGLPAGLTLDASSGLISGTLAAGAAAASPATVTITVTDAGGLTAVSSFQWLVSAAP